MAEPGDYIVVDVAGESLIVVRDMQRGLRAFFNVCRHRGTRMCESDGHARGAIVCPYHAWTYGLDGTLQAARNMQEVPDFDRADCPLLAARVAARSSSLRC